MSTHVQELRERKRHILREMAAADLAFARWKRELEEVREALADAHRAGALEMANHEIRRLRAAIAAPGASVSSTKWIGRWLTISSTSVWSGERYRPR